METMFIYLDPLIDSEDYVLSLREKAKETLRELKTVMTWTGEGVSATKQFVADPLIIMAETRQCLKLMNPSKYGQITNSSRQIRF